MLLIAAAAASPGVSCHAQTCRWELVPGGELEQKVYSLGALDIGGGATLHVAATLTVGSGVRAVNMAAWNGEQWSPLGEGIGYAGVFSMEAFNDGSGPALYVGGPFARAGEILDANGIARWDGQEWSGLGTGLRSEIVPPAAYNAAAMAVFDDGSGGGPALYVGGSFTHAGDQPALNIARWDGSAWSAVGGGVPAGAAGIRALGVFDDGSGPALYAGGYFFGGVARWKDGAWEVGSSSIAVEAFAVFDDGSGPALYAGGQGSGGLMRWDGQQWSVVGGGTDYSVRSLHVFDDGTGPALYVGGSFLHAGGIQVWNIARWDGREWSTLGEGVYRDRGASVNAMTTFDDGSGPALYVAGIFDEAGFVAVQNIARWRCTGCYADCDGDAILDFWDFLCFQEEFFAGGSYADCDGDGEFSFFDFLCFQNSFVAGCP